MKKLICCFSLVCAGLLTSCVDKNEEVDADSMPEWLHGSIYETLQNPQSNGLEGTFNYYLKLADDLNYKETLSRTGSKTVFPANDEAFKRFFENNKWGVTSYEQLSLAQKKLLFYNSMLDNALLTTMLSNVMSGSSVLNGMALRHETNVSVIDSVTHIYGPAGMPANNKYWAKHAQGLDVVYDNTKPMMVHFTRDYLLSNNLTTSGDINDFEILTGTPYDETGNNVFIYGDKVIHADITCQNGYIHQLKDVLMPPGNMAQVIRESDETRYFSRMLDYFSAPYYDLNTTNNYNDWAIANGKELKDSIFQVRYLSSNSQGDPLNVSPDNATEQNLLTFDPGWNQYYNAEGRATSADNVKDMAAMFVPTDKAVIDYFVHGAGSYILEIYGDKPNTEANLGDNLDALFNKQPGIVRNFVRNLQQKSFVNSVPSKFTTITNSATENMGMNMGYLNKKGDKYDLTIANNGVVYVLNSMIAPDELQSVLAPAQTYPDMHVMDWAVEDTKYLGVDFIYYLQAMSANYAFFIPDDQAFDYHVEDTILGHKHTGKTDFNAYYVDPTSLASAQPVALRFYYDDAKGQKMVRVEKFNYDPETNTVGSALPDVVNINDVSTQMVDILNYHTVVLGTGEEIGQRKYYKTKHGGEICVSGSGVGSTVYGGEQVDNEAIRPVIEQVWSEKNGHAYRLNGIIQAPRNSVRTTLEKHEDRFSEFLELCDRFNSASEIMDWAGISSELDKDFKVSPQERYLIFTTTYGSETDGVKNACLGEGNVKFFNTYNYTLYAPNNTAMQKAFAAGLPKWEDVEELYNKYDHEEGAEVSPQEQADKDKAYAMINTIREFIRYHFQSVSLYADRTVDAGEYATFHSDDLGVAQKLDVAFSQADHFTVTDEAGEKHEIGKSGMLTNLMTRDYWFKYPNTTKNNSIATSSFCAVHEIDEPLYMYKKSADGKVHFDTWNQHTANARQKAYNYFKRLNANTKN